MSVLYRSSFCVSVMGSNNEITAGPRGAGGDGRGSCASADGAEVADVSAWSLRLVAHSPAAAECAGLECRGERTLNKNLLCVLQLLILLALYTRKPVPASVQRGWRYFALIAARNSHQRTNLPLTIISYQDYLSSVFGVFYLYVKKMA